MKAVATMTADAVLPPTGHPQGGDEAPINAVIAESWKIVAPFWPLKNLIAVNPLQGFGDQPIEEALIQGAAYFQPRYLPAPMEAVNRLSIQWLQAYFDEGQATLPMPGRPAGLYRAWHALAVFDHQLHGGDADKRQWIASLPEAPEQVIVECLFRLGITQDERLPMLRLMLTTLPGWASHIRYRTEWPGQDADHAHPVTQADYLALRLVITCLLWPDARQLLSWHGQCLDAVRNQPHPLAPVIAEENAYRQSLLQQLTDLSPSASCIRSPSSTQVHSPSAQLVFCIDVRSEPFRRAVESAGNYETFGFAGFFGIPVRITDSTTQRAYHSCPVLLSPKHEVRQTACHAAHQRPEPAVLPSLYQSLKYALTTPFALAETLGLASGLWMGLQTLAPRLASRLRVSAANYGQHAQAQASQLEHDISLADQCSYAETALRMIGLVSNFAPMVILCGHGSATRNNAYATALDCGACGGHHGAPNARLLASMLNQAEVRSYLAGRGIVIPEATVFIAAEHNTTTDAVTLYPTDADREKTGFSLLELMADLEQARSLNSRVRLKHLHAGTTFDRAAGQTRLRSEDWAEVRPEWGLARNAAFIVAPRSLTQSLDLEGRCFLHSYDESADPDGAALTAILTAPMVVGHWINMQYLFSTLDNPAYGGGSKITQNMTGKIGMMQGNASDLMTGLPLQSVHSDDHTAYHRPQRLLNLVYASRARLDAVIHSQPVLRQLFGNGWVVLACIEPETADAYLLQRDGSWQRESCQAANDRMAA